MSLGSDLSQVEIGLAVAAGTAVGSGVWHGLKALGLRVFTVEVYVQRMDGVRIERRPRWRR